MKYTKAQLAAMRKRWAQQRAEHEAKPDIGPEELDRIIDAKLAAHEAELQRLASHHRAEQAHARAAGDKAIFTTLGMLATVLEQGAAQAESERQLRHARAKSYRTRVKNRENARLPREGRRPALRDAIQAAMAPLKQEGIEFRVLMRRWRMERIGSLRLDDLGEGLFRVTNEDGADGAVAKYKRSTLNKLFSQSRNPG